jgi:glucokinase
VIDCARAGDPDAVRLFDEYIYALAMGIISLINIFEPDAVAIGGGVSAAGEFLLDKLKRCIYDHLFYPELPHPDIVLAKLGNDAGIIGAAMLAQAKADIRTL